MSRITDELASLLFDWEEGTLDEVGVERIRQLLRTSEEAQFFYVQYQSLNAALKLDADAGLEPSAAFAPSKVAEQLGGEKRAAIRDTATSEPRRTLRVSYWAAAAAAVLVCGLVGRLLQLEFLSPRSGQRQQTRASQTDKSDGPTRPRQELTSEGVALVTRLVDVVWDEEQRPLEVGDALSPGRIALRSGYAQIEFFCGATVVVEGPAELDLRSALLARVRSGRLRAQVPPAARGFSLEVDDMRVVDLGTEFGLAVSPSEANIQVFDGEVELRQSPTEKRLLTAGNALVRRADGGYTKADMTPTQFLDIRTLESRADDQRDQRYQRWKNWSAVLRRDERVIAYYAFDSEGEWLRRLPSSIALGGAELDGAIVGAEQVEGRWAAKGGLEFKRPGDRVRVQIPGDYRSLTFACWVKIDSLDRWYNSLFLTDGYDKGEPHWQILDSGQVYFSVRPASQHERGKRDYKALSPVFWEPTMSGRWMHLAVTFDTAAREIVHYLNGEQLSRHVVPESQLPATTRIGTASIGNWSIPTRPDAEFAIRNLNGSLDEFVIFAAALSAGEIREMYENGKP